MQQKYQESPQEIDLSADINRIQSFIGNDITRVLFALLTQDLSANKDAVLGGFVVSISAPFTTYTISPGIAIQSLSIGLDPGDYNAELMFLYSPGTLTVAPPTATTRVDVIEMQAQPRQIQFETRSFVNLTTGQPFSRSTPKTITSQPLFRIRQNVTGGGIFDPAWIPIALVQNGLSGLTPFFNIFDCRPFYRLKNNVQFNGNLTGEISSPSTNALGGQLALQFSNGGITFDNQYWPFPNANGGTVLISSLYENGFILGSSPTHQTLHLYIAKPDMGVYSPDAIQFLVTNKQPTNTGQPSSALMMNGAFAGFPTVAAMHLCSFVVTPTVILGVLQPVCTGFRKVNGFTAVGELDAIWSNTINSGAGTTFLLSFFNMPQTASFVRMVINFGNDVGFTSVTKLGAYTNVATPTLVNYSKIFAFPGSASNAVIDFPLIRGPGAPVLGLVGDAPFEITYRVIGYGETNDATIVQNG